jgi:hypothetical protein
MYPPPSPYSYQPPMPPKALFMPGSGLPSPTLEIGKKLHGIRTSSITFKKNQAQTDELIEKLEKQAKADITNTNLKKGEISKIQLKNLKEWFVDHISRPAITTHAVSLGLNPQQLSAVNISKEIIALNAPLVHPSDLQKWASSCLAKVAMPAPTPKTRSTIPKFKKSISKKSKDKVEQKEREKKSQEKVDANDISGDDSPDPRLDKANTQLQALQDKITNLKAALAKQPSNARDSSLELSHITYNIDSDGINSLISSIKGKKHKPHANDSSDDEDDILQMDTSTPHEKYMKKLKARIAQGKPIDVAKCSPYYLDKLKSQGFGQGQTKRGLSIVEGRIINDSSISISRGIAYDPDIIKAGAYKLIELMTACSNPKVASLVPDRMKFVNKMLSSNYTYASACAFIKDAFLEYPMAPEIFKAAQADSIENNQKLIVDHNKQSKSEQARDQSRSPSPFRERHGTRHKSFSSNKRGRSRSPRRGRSPVRRKQRRHNSPRRSSPRDRDRRRRSRSPSSSKQKSKLRYYCHSAVTKDGKCYQGRNCSYDHSCASCDDGSKHLPHNCKNYDKKKAEANRDKRKKLVQNQR